MRKLILSLILFSGFSGSGLAAVSGNALQADAPDRHAVVKGDTLWGISKKFLKDPWKWPELWGLNANQVKNPHLIYPGQVLVLEKRADGTVQMKAAGLQTVKLEPHVRVEPSGRESVPSVPPSLIEPFLSKPLVVEAGAFESAARLIAGGDQRVIFGSGDTIYATGIGQSGARMWHVYRKGRPLIDPDTGENLGNEAVYLGDARVVSYGPVTKLEIVYANQEIHQNDALTPSPGMAFVTYVPHAPRNPVSGRIISAYGGLAEVGQNGIVSINRGTREGLEKGHVLAVYRDGEVVDTSKGQVTLPGDRIGLLFVFRTFERVSYALVAESARPVHLRDVVTRP
jgi:LysM repeat protein